MNQYHSGSRTRATWVKARNPNRWTIWECVVSIGLNIYSIFILHNGDFFHLFVQSRLS